jgi:CRISPR-associated endonuclease/helicase Cas3
MVHGEGVRFRNRHEILSLAFLECLAAPEEEAAWIAAAVATHHRELSFVMSRFAPADNFGVAGTYAAELAAGIVQEDAGLLRSVLRAAGEVFDQTAWPFFEPYVILGRESDYVADMRSALRRAEWLGRRFVPKPQVRPGAKLERDWPGICGAIHARGWLINADHLASFGARHLERAIASVGDAEDQLRVGIRRRHADSPERWSSHQAAAREMEGSALLGAPTGSGKTEAGLLWAARQAENGARGRVYVVLPYQTSMNAMQERLIGDLFPPSLRDPGQWNEHVALIHGRSVRRIFELLANGGIELESAAELARLQADLARLNAAPVVVCSAFALIRGLFATKRAEETLAPFSQARIVLDEVHAYDTDVTAMTLAALRFMEERLEARTLIMSATTPSHLCLAIQKALGPRAVIAAGSDVLDRPPRHRLQLLEADAMGAAAMGQIRERANHGSVLVVVNQIRRATELYRRLRSIGLDVTLLHGRFNGADRARIERNLAPRTGRVLVGTQAVEVSLDLDFDCCFSELAPVESLLQRFGRVNRYGDRPPAETKVFVRFDQGSERGHFPYRSGHLAQVLAALRRHCERDQLLHERAVQELIDSSYPPDLAADLSRAIVNKSEDVRRVLIEGFCPFGMRDMSEVAALEQAWSDLFDGGEVLPMNLVPAAAEAKSWIERSRYLVPISGPALRWVDPKWDEELKCFTTECPYSCEYGLTRPAR